MNKELLNKISGLTKEQMLALWESSQKEENNIHDYKEWLDYLDNLPDETGFNHVVASNLLRVVSDMCKVTEGFTYPLTHFDEVKYRTKEMSLYFPEVKHYFPIHSKKEMEKYDFSLYKFD